jgi:hypothetical protein
MAWLYDTSLRKMTTSRYHDIAGVPVAYGNGMEPLSATVAHNIQSSSSTPYSVRYAESNAVARSRINEDHLTEGILVLVPSYGHELHTARKFPAKSSPQEPVSDEPDAEPTVVHHR